MTTKAALVILSIVVVGMNYVAETVGIDLFAKFMSLFS